MHDVRFRDFQGITICSPDYLEMLLMLSKRTSRV